VDTITPKGLDRGRIQPIKTCKCNTQ